MSGRQKHTHEQLIKRIKEYLAQPRPRGLINDSFIVCRGGLEDALAELEKPVLPDNAQELILAELTSTTVGMTNLGLSHKIHQALLPKPKTITVWRVDRGPGWVNYDTESEAMGVARQWVERGESVRIDKHEVPL